MADVASGTGRHIDSARIGLAPLLAVILVLTLSGCGGGTVPTPTAQTTPQATADESPSAEATETPPEPTATPVPPPDDDIVAGALAWIINLGPGSSSGPDAVAAYLLIQDGREATCREAFRTQLPEKSAVLYHGAAAACLAALHGKSARWADAESAYESLDGRPEGCLDRATFDLLESVVTAHRQHPNAEFERDDSSAISLPCPTISDVTVMRDSDGALDIRVSGDRLGQVLAVTLQYLDECPDDLSDIEGSLRVESLEKDRRSLRATSPADEESVDAQFIWVGLIAAPDPWVAGADCVAITDES